MSVENVDVKKFIELHERGQHEDLVRRTSFIDLENADMPRDLNVITVAILRGKALLMLGRVRDAEQVVTRIQNFVDKMADQRVVTHSHVVDASRSELLLLKAEMLISKGLFDEALSILNGLEDTIAPFLSIQALYLKGVACWRLGKLDEAEHHLKSALETISRGKHSSYLKASCQQRLGNVYHRKGQLKDALEWLRQALDAFKQLQNQYMVASCLNSIGSVFYSKGDYKKAAQHYEDALGIARALKNRHLLMLLYNNMGLIQWTLGHFDEALTYFKQSHKILKQEGDKNRIAIILDNIGLIYRQRGELEEALKYQLESLELKKQFANKEDVAVVLKNIGMTYYEYGDETLALQYLRESLNMLEELDSAVRISEVIFYLIIVLTNLRPIPREEVTRYLSRLEKCAKENPPNIIIQQRLSCSQALIAFKLRQGNDADHRLPRRLRIQVEYVLSKIIEEDIIDHEITFQALITLIAFYFEELQYSNDVELFTRLKELLDLLIEVGERQQSMIVKLYAFWLKAKFELIHGNLDKARRILADAENLADEWGLHRLSMAISEDHDELLEVIETLDNNDLATLTIQERIERSRVKDLMSVAARRHQPSLREQNLRNEPVMFLIIGENGILLHHVTFSRDVKGNPLLIGGLLSAIQSFTKELFSDGVDRLKVGENNIILGHLDKFLLAYVFKGSSHEALKTMKNVVHLLNDSSDLTRALTDGLRRGTPLSSEVREALDRLLINATLSA